MQYRNPKIREGINVSKTHPLAEFAGLLAGVLAIGVALTVAAYLLAAWLVRFIPLPAERAMLATFDEEIWSQRELTQQQRQIEQYLQRLAQRLVSGLELPEDLLLQIHYSDSEQMNAYATLGGHIVINRGLLGSVQSENGLAMVLGHEIGHVLHRDPLLAMGRATVTVAALALLSGFSETRVANTFFAISADSLRLGFSRDQEREADTFGLALLQHYYGHQGGAEEFFQRIQVAEKDSPTNALLVEFFSTHPDLDQRVARLRNAAAESDLALVGLPFASKGDRFIW